MSIPKIFVASSSEGLEVVNSVQKLLQQTLGGTAEVAPWSGKFQLTRSYIESLERILDTYDFAVLVLTPDDRTRSRETETLSPRDNVVFELGLFFGNFGRDRCFFIQRSDLELKRPSDLQGIESAKFSISPGQDLETALQPACIQIGEAISDAIKDLPSKPKLGAEGRALQSAMRKFGDRIAGTWWERISLAEEKPALSFFTIELDDVYSSVKLEGKAYDNDGIQRAKWRSAAARLEGNTIVYVRECRRLDIKNPAWLPGLGEVDFEVSSDVINRGDGKFWESYEANTKDTLIKTVEVRRNQNESYASTMRQGSEGERQALVQKMLGSW